MVICIAAQKGGTGKTTTAHALHAAMLRRGKSCLSVDLDGQANLTRIMVGPADEDTTIADLITGRQPADRCIIHTESGDLVPGSAEMYIIEQAPRMRKADRIRALTIALQPIRTKYDCIILDTPPALSLPTMCALYASDAVIIPLSADDFGLASLEQLQTTIDYVVQLRTDPLHISGIILTLYNGRTKVSADYRDMISDKAQEMGTGIIGIVRPCEAVRKAQAMGEDIFSFSRTSNASKDYDAITDALLKDLEELNDRRC